MASSGSLTASGGYQGRTITFNWWRTGTNSSSLQTTIGWNMVGSGNAQSSWYKSGNFKVLIDGSQAHYSSTRIQLYNGTVIASGSWTFQHDGAGNKSFSVHIEAGIYTVAVNTRGDGSWALDNVGYPPTGATMTAPSNSYISETTNTITVSWNKGSSYNGSGEYRVDVSINGGAYNWVSGSLGLNTTSWTYTIPNKTPGTTYRFRIDTGNNVGWSGHSYSGTVTINELTCGNINVANVFNPYTATTNGSNAILPVSFTAGTQNVSGTLYYKAQLYYKDSLVTSNVFTSEANAKTLNIEIPPDTYVTKLGATKYSDTFTIKAWLENQNGTKSSIVQTSFKTDINTDGGAVPTLAEPVFSGGVLSNPSTCFIENFTKITITSGQASLQRAPSNATLKYTIKANYSEVKEGSTATFECWQLGTYDCVVTVTDSRGLSKSVTKQYVVQTYAPPRVVITSSGRKTSPNTTGTISYTVYYSPIYQYTSPTVRGNQLNGISLQQCSKNNSSWTNYTTGSDIIGLDVNHSYDFIIRVADKVYPTEYSTDKCIIPTIKSLLSLRSWGAGIRCVPQAGRALEVTGLSQFNGNVNIVDGVLNTQNNVEIRNGTAKTEETMLDFGWANGSSQYTIKLTSMGSLAFETYSDGVYQARPFQLSYDGEVYCNDIQATNINALGTIRTSRIQNDGSSVGIGSVKIASNGEWLGMYDTGLNTRYFWMGRNESTSGNMYFCGLDNIKKFYFDKPIYAPSALSSDSTQKAVMMADDPITPSNYSMDTIVVNFNGGAGPLSLELGDYVINVNNGDYAASSTNPVYYESGGDAGGRVFVRNGVYQYRINYITFR